MRIANLVRGRHTAGHDLARARVHARRAAGLGVQVGFFALGELCDARGSMPTPVAISSIPPGERGVTARSQGTVGEC